MKKNLIFIFVIIIFLPLCVSAKEQCVIISGTGKNVGDEIACGTEHFYVIENDSKNIRMLSKYNLNIGVTIYKEKIEKEAGDTRTDLDYCYDLADERGGYIKNDEFYYAPGYCFYAKQIQPEHILQSEEAKSAHWDKDGNYIYPQVADNYIPVNEQLYLDFTDGDIYGDSGFFDFKVVTNESSYLSFVLNQYQQELTDIGINVTDIGMLSVNDINNISKLATDKNLPLKDWATAVENIPEGDYNDYISTVSFGDLKPYIPEKYSWLYSTSYWNSTVYSSNKSYSGIYYVFVSGLGKLCGAGFEYCAPETAIGCGIRPVVSVPIEDLIYKITVETDNNGTVEVINESKGNESIEFKLTSKEGYKLRYAEIIADDSTKIEFKTKQTSGDTIIISTNEFLMPYSNVVIKVSWDKILPINPETSETIIIVLLIAIISSAIILIIKKQMKRFD